jgi:uncharacterized surface protein with fasciclin (FAS1) repeats
MSSISQVVNVDKHMTTLKKGVIAAGLDKMLNETGPFTVFAPSEQAFRQLDKDVLEDLLKPESRTKLTDVLNLHVVPGKIKYKDLKDGEKLRTINGTEIQVQVRDGAVSIDGAKIHGTDVQASNGVIYSLDTVMVKN